MLNLFRLLRSFDLGLLLSFLLVTCSGLLLALGAVVSFLVSMVCLAAAFFAVSFEEVFSLFLGTLPLVLTCRSL